MKKMTVFMCAVLLAVLVAAPSFAASSWEEFETRIARSEKIKICGEAVLNEFRKKPINATEEELWRALQSGTAYSRASAGIALSDAIFPDKDPSRWQEVSGMFPKKEFAPRQLAALDGLFAAVIALKDIPDGVWGAAYLLDSFAKSSFGRLKFIDDMPKELKDAIEQVISETGLVLDLTDTRVRGKLPLLPRFGGDISDNEASGSNMQFLDGYGSLSNSAFYAWDRNKGIGYKILDYREFNSKNFWIF